MTTFCFLLYLTSLCLSLVLADYTIDDSNYTTLKFSENPAGPVWGPFGSDTGLVLGLGLPNGTMQTVDATQCYDGTFTYAACNTSNNCAVQFSFTGSGITIYVLRAGPQGMSASLSIDSGTATTATLDAPPAPQYYIPQVALFDVQNIPSGTHTAVMTVLDWDGGFSGMMLDYIDVNQAEVTTSSSPSSTPTPSSSTPTSQQASSQGSLTTTQAGSATVVTTATPSGNGTTNATSANTNIAAAVGGGVGGGVGLVALVGLIIFCFRRRGWHHQKTQNDPFLEANAVTPNITPFEGSASPPITQTGTFGATHTTPSRTETGPSSTPISTARDQNNSRPIANNAHAVVASSGNDGVTSVSTSTPAQVAQPVIPAGSIASPVSYPHEKSEPASSPLMATFGQDQVTSQEVLNTSRGAALTDEQADFVNSLFNHNVPAPVVAQVLERMVANPHGASTGANDPELRAHLESRAPGGGSRPSVMEDVGDGETMTGTAPPSYEYVYVTSR